MTNKTPEELDEQLIASIISLDLAEAENALQNGANVTLRRKRKCYPIGANQTPMLLIGNMESALLNKPDTEYRRVPPAVVKLCRTSAESLIDIHGRDECISRLINIRNAMAQHFTPPFLG
ncbi:hypothetical protein RSSM_06875 [Rhodopirellula sallentina SM41]|uniref:Uncharacterized protein n=2 Tax=Rhodopirellula TaxID=265488 RepID=M5U1F4_9BACT|nr:hypothetical protein RSSM_06875 [Rhodopirellula sallentina SM41]